MYYLIDLTPFGLFRETFILSERDIIETLFLRRDDVMIVNF